MKRIVYTRPDGGVTVVYPSPRFLAKFGTEEEGLAALMAKAVPPGVTDAEILDESEIPTDQSYFDAWRKVGGKIEVDMGKARAIAALRMQRRLRVKIRDLLEREALGEDVSTEITKLRAIRPVEIMRGASTPDEVKTRWPAELCD